MLKLYLNETRKILWNRSFWVALAGGTALTTLILWLGYSQLAGGERFPVTAAVLGLSKMAGLVFVVLVGTWTAQEYNWRTLPLALSRGVQRVPWLLARFSAALPPLALAMAVPFGLAWGLELAYASQVPELMRRAGADLLPTFGKLALSVLPYLALATLAAVFTRSVALAVGIPLFLALVVESIVNAFWPRVGQYLPTPLGEALLRGGSDVWTVAAGLAAYAVVFMALASLRLRRQDLGG